MKPTIAAAVALVSMVALADGRLAPFPLAEARFNAHPEHKGAAGSMSETGGVYTVNYDFSNGGHGVGVDFKLVEPVWAEKVVFDARVGERQNVSIGVKGDDGQCFHKHAVVKTPGQWTHFEADVGYGWGAHWGGKNDGVLRLPIKAVSLNVDRKAKGAGNPQETGVFEIRNVAYVEMPEERRRDAVFPRPSLTLVSYVVSDFNAGASRFSSGPRVFCQRNGNYRDGSRPVDGGCMTCDFAKGSEFSIHNEIPVWGEPVAYRLSVEAPAAAAGMDIFLALKMRRTLHGGFGRIDAQPDGSGVIRQTFTLSADLTDENLWKVPWGDRKTALNAVNKRICGLIARRGACKASDPLTIRFVRLEAVVEAGKAVPPVLATPPAGPEPPKELELAFLNLEGVVREDATAQVTMRDWNGNVLGQAVAHFPETRPGECSKATAALPPVEGGCRYIQYLCTLSPQKSGVPPAKTVETSWTRPWHGEGTRERRPDLPWGFNVCLGRTEDRYAYPSGYETPTNETALAEAETRAALARKAGIKWERFELKIAQVAVPGKKGEYDFSVYDRLLDIADRNGLTCCICCSHYWPDGYKGYTREAMDEWAKIVGLAVRRWKGRCRHWEIWNEVNHGNFWSGTVEQYVYLCNKAYDEIKSADPGATVMAISSAGIDPEFMDRCIAAGMKCDTISVHPYRAEPTEEKFLSDLASVTNRTRGAKTFLTEMGWSTGLDRATRTERVQAGNLVRSYLTAAGSRNAVAVFGYNFVDDGFNVLERENNFGILRRDLTIKPAYRALATVFNFFSNGEARLEKRELSPKCTAWIFRMGGRCAVWTTVDAVVHVECASAAKAIDLMGATLGEFETGHEVRTGPTSAVLFDGDVVGVKFVATPEREPVTVGF